ncbi:hypothetical protein [Bilophila wadsworthia]|uniref:hypothetical protein n=1 Tax=Bilophila wadsworthia TaxID=35833 RepID=UPI00399D4C1C
MMHPGLHLLQSSTLSTCARSSAGAGAASTAQRYPDPALDRVLAVRRGADGRSFLELTRGEGNPEEGPPPGPPTRPFDPGNRFARRGKPDF